MSWPAASRREPGEQCITVPSEPVSGVVSGSAGAQMGRRLGPAAGRRVAAVEQVDRRGECPVRERPGGAVRTPMDALVDQNAVAVLVLGAGPQPASVRVAGTVDVGPEQLGMGERPVAQATTSAGEESVAGELAARAGRLAGRDRGNSSATRVPSSSATSCWVIDATATSSLAVRRTSSTPAASCAAIAVTARGPFERIAVVGVELARRPGRAVGRAGRAR